MEKKLVVIATHSYERAQLLKTLLEDYKIEVCLEDINLMGGTFIKGARVCVWEEDLERALGIVEEAYQRMALEKPSKSLEMGKKILIPVDFAHNWENIVRLGFDIAQHLQGEIMFIHVYYSPILGGIPFSDTFSYSMEMDESFKNTAEKAKTEMDSFMNLIRKRIKSGILPKVKMNSSLLSGIPEDEIIAFAAAYKPLAIIMGTRGVDKKMADMIGSVTAEVMERVTVPVFAIPDEATTKVERGMNLMYVTNFEERDFHSFDQLLKLLVDFEMNFHIVHFAEEKTIKSQAHLAGIERIFRERYANCTNVKSSIIVTSDFLSGIENFVRDHDIDVISLTTHRRNIFARIFNPGIAHNMLFHSDTPMLIFHS